MAIPTPCKAVGRRQVHWPPAAASALFGVRFAAEYRDPAFLGLDTLVTHAGSRRGF